VLFSLSFPWDNSGFAATTLPSSDGHSQAMTDLKPKIQEHYDELSPYYHDLWGRHIHHGFWVKGDETKEEAQIRLIEEMIHRGNLRDGSKVLDVGCGVGGTAIHLAKTLKASVTGITLSPIQRDMAERIAQEEGAQASTRFLHMDGENMTLEDQSFDFAWICEVLSHFSRKDKFFGSAHRILKPNGRIILADWFKAPDLTQEQHKKYIVPIEHGMLLPQLNTMGEYQSLMEQNGFKVVHSDDITSHVSKTWDICVDLILNPTLWKLAFTKGGEALAFLRAFQSMRAGYSSGTFRYGIIVAEKVPSPSNSKL